VIHSVISCMAFLSVLKLEAIYHTETSVQFERTTVLYPRRMNSAVFIVELDVPYCVGINLASYTLHRKRSDVCCLGLFSNCSSLLVWLPFFFILVLWFLWVCFENFIFPEFRVLANCGR
jgi:hypothetical protein